MEILLFIIGAFVALIALLLALQAIGLILVMIITYGLKLYFFIRDFVATKSTHM
jgi:hypothetical protein